MKRNALIYTKKEGQRQRHRGDKETQKETDRQNPHKVGRKSKNQNPIFPERDVVLNVSGGLG